MRHAAHKANKGSVQRTSPSALFRSSRGSHTARAVRAVRAANGDAVALAIDPVLAAKLNEVAPMTRRAIRETAKAAQRKSYMMSSASLAALVGTAATALAFSNIQQSSNSRLLADDPATTTTQLARVTGSTVSRSESRTELGPIASDQTAAAATSGAADAKTSNTIADAKSVQTTNNGNWELNDKNSAIDVSQLSRSLANNPQVAVLVDQDAGKLCDQSGLGDRGGHTSASPSGLSAAMVRRTCVAISSACLSDHISAMVRTGRTPLVRTATGWTTRLATRATSWCSARVRKARVPCMAMSPSWRASTLTARSPSRSAALR